MRTSLRRLLLLLLGIAALQVAGLLLYRSVERGRGGGKGNGFPYEKIEPPKLAPEVSFENMKGGSVRLTAYRGESVLLHFWATWCAPCRAELPSLLARSDAKQSPRGPALLLVSLDENWEVIRHYFHGAVPLQVVRDSGRTAEREFEVQTLPETLFVRADGNLAARIRGARNWQTEAARSTLDLLARADLTGPSRP